MICNTCASIFQPDFDAVEDISYLHHPDTASFRNSLRKGCQLCWALGSEIKNVEETLRELEVASQTWWTCYYSDSNDVAVLLAWSLNGRLRHSRWVSLVEIEGEQSNTGTPAQRSRNSP